MDEVIENDERKYYLKPEQEVRNYYLALNYLEEKAKKKEKFSKKLILDVQKYVEKGAPKDKIGLRGQTPPGVLFAVYDSETGDFIPIGVSKELGVTNKTVINRLSTLVKNGFVLPNLSGERIRSYVLRDFSKQHLAGIKKLLK